MRTRDVIFFALVLSVAQAHAAHLNVDPARVLEGDAASIRIEDAKPGDEITVHAQSVMLTANKERRAFYAHASFKVPDTGIVDLARTAPLSGSYSGSDLRGLFWSQTLVAKEEERVIAALQLTGVQALVPDQVVLTLERAGRIDDRQTLTLIPNSSDVSREDVRVEGLVGALYTAKGAAKRPVVVILSGSEGGLSYANWLGPKLASRGFTAFGLAYFAKPTEPIEGVPTALNRIPVELLEKARAFLTTRPEADVERFGIVGGSKGGEFALVLASIYDWVDVVAAFVPSDYVMQGFQFRGGEVGMGSSWTRGGIDLPFVPETGLRDEILNGRKPGGEIRLARVRNANLAVASAQTLAAARIPIERSHAALLLAGGDDDQTGASGASVRRVAEALQTARYARPVDILVYPKAGHGIVDTGWRPTTLRDQGPFRDGGTPEADARAQTEGWEHMIALLKREFGR